MRARSEMPLIAFACGRPIAWYPISTACSMLRISKRSTRRTSWRAVSSAGVRLGRGVRSHDIEDFTYTWYDPKGPIGPQEFADMAVELFLQGFAPDGAAKPATAIRREKA